MNAPIPDTLLKRVAEAAPWYGLEATLEPGIGGSYSCCKVRFTTTRGPEFLQVEHRSGDAAFLMLDAMKRKYWKAGCQAFSATWSKTLWRFLFEGIIDDITPLSIAEAFAEVYEQSEETGE